MYIKHLMNDIRRRKISVRMARHYLSVVNRFLLTGGQIQRRYEYEFLPKGTYQQQGRDSYTRNELSEILRQLSSMNEFLAGCIREHIAKSEKGCGISHRLCWHLFMKRISGIRERTGQQGRDHHQGRSGKLLSYFFFFCSVTTHGETPLRFWV